MEQNCYQLRFIPFHFLPFQRTERNGIIGCVRSIPVMRHHWRFALKSVHGHSRESSIHRVFFREHSIAQPYHTVPFCSVPFSKNGMERKWKCFLTSTVRVILVPCFFTCVLGMYCVAAVCTSEHGAHNSGTV